MKGLGDVLTAGRKARGLTQAELGLLIGVTQVAINRYEAGEREPDGPTIEKLADALGVTERLLRHGASFRGAIAVDAHMRRQKTTKASLWRRMEARMNMLRLHSSFLFEEVSIHADQQVPTFDPDDTSPEHAARLVRAQWRLPIGPVVNLTGWLESAGCLVFDEDFATHRIDALSQWVGDHPVILINTALTPDRWRLTLAHELGHLVLHSNQVHEDMEGQANAFAAEFLMPEVAIRPELRSVELGRLLDLKREWGVSIQALFERAFRLGLVATSARTSFYKALNARGWKSREPGNESVTIERPSLPRHIGAVLAGRGLSDGEIDELAGYRAGYENPFRPLQPRLRSL